MTYMPHTYDPHHTVSRRTSARLTDIIEVPGTGHGSSVDDDIVLIEKWLKTRFMKKVLFICDGRNFSKAAFEFIKSLNEAEKILVTGVFYLSVDFRILIPSSLYPDPEPLATLVEDEREQVKKTVEVFEEDCIKNAIEYRVHNAGEPWSVADLEKETRFSDLMVISEEMFFRNWGGDQPNHFMRQALHHAECPVMIIPEGFTTIEKLVVAYDGKDEALFALKSFSLLFPNLSNVETQIIYINESETGAIPNLDHLEEYAARHFSNLSIERLPFNAERYLTNWIVYSKNALLITGAFSRSGVSNILKKSFVEKIIKEHSIPVFIAHK